MRYFLIIALLVAGCKVTLPDRYQTNSIANQVLKELLIVYKADQEACLTTAYPFQCVADVRYKWEPVWSSYDALYDAKDLAKAWCDFLNKVSDRKIYLPSVEFLKKAC